MNYTKTNSLNKLKCTHKIEKQQNITTSNSTIKSLRTSNIMSTYETNNIA